MNIQTAVTSILLSLAAFEWTSTAEPSVQLFKIDEQADLFFFNSEFRPPVMDDTGVFYNQRVAGGYQIKRNGTILLATGTTVGGIAVTGVPKPWGAEGGKFLCDPFNGGGLALYNAGALTSLIKGGVTALPTQHPNFVTTFRRERIATIVGGRAFLAIDPDDINTPPRWGAFYMWNAGVWSEMFAFTGVTVPSTQLGPGGHPVVFRSIGATAVNSATEVSFTASGKSVPDDSGAFFLSNGAYQWRPATGILRLMDTSMLLPGQAEDTPVTGFGAIGDDGAVAAMTVMTAPAIGDVESAIVVAGVGVNPATWVDRFVTYSSPAAGRVWQNLHVADFRDGHLLFVGDSIDVNNAGAPIVHGLYRMENRTSPPVKLLDSSTQLDGKDITAIETLQPCLTATSACCRIVFSDFSEAIYRIQFANPPGPEIAVEQPQGMDLADNGARDFGSVLTSGTASLEFIVRNTGNANLTGLAITKTGTAAGMFIVTANPAAPVVGGGTSSFTVKFAPTSAGLKTAVLHIANNDSDENPFDINVSGTGIVPVLPVVRTLAAQVTAHDAATLNASVDAKGSDRAVTFDYGITTAYGAIATAAQSPAIGSGVTLVSAGISGLLPHTKYNFRVHAAGTLGAATGANLMFTTLDRPPSPGPDDLVVLPNAKVTIPVLANDTDADGDTLTLLSFTPPLPAGRGTVTKTGNVLVVTASTGFDGASFGYTVSDGFGKSSTGLVTLTKGICNLTPDGVTLPSAGITYPVAVDATGAWSVNESLTFATVTPLSGNGNGTVYVTLLPNAAKVQRAGSIDIGGKPHAITQLGVMPPDLSMPASIPAAMVGDPFTLTIPTVNPPVTYSVVNLPSGLAINQATGVISGVPAKGGTSHLTIKAANAAAVAPTVLNFDIVVQSVPSGTVGAFQGYVTRNDVLNGNLGSRIELNPTAAATFTGKVITGTASKSISGKLITHALDPKHPRCLVAIPGTAWTLDVTLDDDLNALTGSVNDGGALIAPVTAWRNAWNSTSNKATKYAVLHTFSLEQSSTGVQLPQGYGYGSFTPALTTGILTVSGKLADGSAFATSTFMGQQGQVLLYQPLYANAGSFAGVLQVNTGDTPADNTLSGAPTWYKPQSLPKAKDRVYPAGFGPLILVADGGSYPALAPGGLVMGLLSPPPDNARLAFSKGGLDAEGKEFGPNVAVSNPSTSGLTIRATFTDHTNSVTMPTLTATTGAFSGDFTLAGATTAANRKTPYQGLIVKHAAGVRGYGYFLLAKPPAAVGETVANTQQLSGKVLLAPIPLVVLNSETSYHHFKEEGLQPQTLPAEVSWSTARAYADFFGDGSLGLFTATLTYDATKPIAQATPSIFEFWRRQTNGSFVRDTTLLSNSNGGCLHPRKALVADFNGDGRPDVFVACHGYDNNPFPGERNRVVLSQPGGTYLVADAATDVAFFHGATAADLNNDGHVDVITVGGGGTGVHNVFLNQGNGTFVRETKNRLPAFLNFKPYFTAELLDVNGDGIPDLAVGGHEWQDAVTRVYLNPGNYDFTASSPITLPAVAGEGVVLDFVVTGIGATRALWALRTSGGDGTFYQSRTVQKVMWPSLQFSLPLHERPGQWIPWLIPVVSGSQHGVGGDDTGAGVWVAE